MPQKVLIIDDSDSIQALLKVRLRNEPIEILSAIDGEGGFEMALRAQPDLILLDVEMPGANGFDICKKLKNDLRTFNIPIIFLTGAASTEEKIHGLDLGAIDYIIKPFDIAELRARVRAGLRTKFLLDLLSKKAMIDGLTGLWNRGYFDQRLAAETALCSRSNQPFSVIMIDIDHFKKINDQLGHPAGDIVLATVAQILSDSCRTQEVVCRYGGEEFAIIAPGTQGDNAVELAKRLCRLISSYEFVCRGVQTPITCSFGVARYDASDPNIVEQADKALYKAKQNGRNRVEVAFVEQKIDSETAYCGENV